MYCALYSCNFIALQTDMQLSNKLDVFNVCSLIEIPQRFKKMKTLSAEAI